MQIKGNFKKTFFKSDKGYQVGLFKVKDVSDDLYKEHIGKSITFSGYLPPLNETDYYLLDGEFVIHEKYGLQFKANSCEVLKPEGKDAIVIFLSSDIFKGIGEKIAKKIVDVFGDDTLDVIMENPSNLMLVPGITEKQKNTIATSLEKYQESYQTIIYLTKLGFNMRESLLIYYKSYGNTRNVVENNIYSLVNDIKEINFKKIDSLKENLNISSLDNRRIEAGIKYVFDMVAATKGDIYLYKDELINYVMRALLINEYDLIEECLSNLITHLEVINKGEKYYLDKYYQEELYVSKRLIDLTRLKDDKLDLNLYEHLEKVFNITFNSKQKEAIIKSIESPFLIITGGPGTGKTTIIKAIVDLYSSHNKIDYEKMMKELILLAPTGRASKRISELTNFPASTIHRFLKWDKDSNTFGVNINNKSDAKMVIIDEASMIDLNLFYSLLQGLHDDTKIVIVGDYDQLPSVGCGQVLKDLIESDCFLVVELKELYRQKETSNIIKFAYDIKNDSYDNSIFLGEDLTFIPCNNSNLKERLYEIVKDYTYKDYDKFQVLAPIYAYDNGIDDLNNYLQDIINPKKDDNFIAVGEEIFRVNDKVIQLVNMPDENVYNGDVGIVEKISIKPKEIYVRYDENVVKYTPSIFDNIKHGFCISIHKSQGSEFDTVVIPVLYKYSRMLYKKLIYTAVTRSKRKLYILGEEGALKEAINNNSYKDRKTTLKDFIIDGINH